ncbi:Hypothetical protein BQ3484_16 [Cedratvirus A11]|uniref:Uncharacterized protein n=1 Tax=Cedratvirus A11 TaxID=1903266 RepID=A0A1M7XTS7_9VIRU|nr:Hypothetical protein BQ3484_16 [Cedratvirus A11]SHO33084.1 Hypothetical protein BQ3484_16 [Cedratvirus A11]
MESDINIFINFRSVDRTFLELAHQVGGPIKFSYHYLEALSYQRLFPVTTHAVLSRSTNLPKKVKTVSLDVYKKRVNIKAYHLQSLRVIVGGGSSPRVTIDVQSVDKLKLEGERIFFPLKFPVRELEIHFSCDASLLNLEHVESLYIKGYSGLTGDWPVLPRLKYLTEETQGFVERPMSSVFFPNLRRIIKHMPSKKFFEGELLLVHSVSALDQGCSCVDLYLTTDITKVPSRKNVIYIMNKVEQEDILPLNKASVRFFSDIEITPEITSIVKTLCGEAKIFLRGQVRLW